MLKALIFGLLVSCQAYATEFGQFMNAVVAAGTEERLIATDLTVLSVVIQAEPDNTGNIFVGTGAVAAANYGVVLDANERLTLNKENMAPGSSGINLKDIYIDAGTNGDGVSVFYTTK